MEKEGDFVEQEISVLNQLILTLEQTIEKLKQAYETKDGIGFVRFKKSILDIQEQINKTLLGEL